MLFDTHAHYDDERFDGDRDALLASMPERGVELIVNPGCTVKTSRTAVELAARFAHVYAAVGIHPENCHDFTPAQIDDLRALAARPKVVAIGEIGLDYYWAENPPRELQQDVLRRQMALAQELSLPVIIHDRDAHADTMAIVREFPRVTGVFHCFAGSVEMARELLALGWNNLLSNAIKFTDDGGKITVSLRNDGPMAIVKVADTGCGIDRETGKHIFEKFYQGDTSRATRGNGLGLALVRRVVEIVGGNISVESQVGKGSVFTIEIRRKQNG